MQAMAQQPDQAGTIDPMEAMAAGKPLPAPPLAARKVLPQWAVKQGVADPWGGGADNSFAGATAAISNLPGVPELGAAAAATEHNALPFLEGRPTNWTGDYGDVLDATRDASQTFAKNHPTRAALGPALLSLPFMGAGAAESAAPQTFTQAMATAPVIGGGVGGVTGFAQGQGGFQNRLNSAGKGAMMGAVLGGVSAPLGYAAGSAVNLMGNKLAGTQGAIDPAFQMFTDSLDGKTTPQQLADALSVDKSGMTTPLDLSGDNSKTQRLGRALVTVNGPASGDITGQLDERNRDQYDRVMSSIKTNLAPTVDTYGQLTDLAQQRSAAAQPLYEEAASQAPVITDRLQQFADAPEIQKGFAQGITLARREALTKGVPFDPNAYAIKGFDAAGDPQIGAVPTWKTWFAAKEGLDDMIEQKRNPITLQLPKTKDVNSLVGVKNALVDQLDSINPAYKAARAAWGGPSVAIDAVNQGQNFLNMDPEEIKAAQERLPDSAQDFFKIGAARAMADKAGAAAKIEGTANVAKSIAGTQKIRDRLAATFGPDAAQNFGSDMDSESNMFNTSNTLLKGSQTTNKLADLVSPGGMRKYGALAAKGAIAGGMLRGDLSGAAMGAVGFPTAEFLGNKISELGERTALNDPETASKLGQLLMAKGQSGADLLRNSAVPYANAMATKSAQKAALLANILKVQPALGIAAGNSTQ